MSYTPKDAELEEWKKMFGKYDKDGNGSIDNKEMIEILKEMGENPSEEDIGFLMPILDSNGDGVLSLEEFINMMKEFFGIRAKHTAGK